MDTASCWLPKDGSPCGTCFGCYLDFLLSDPVWKKYRKQREHNRAIRSVYRDKGED